jgi:hypothetical protein
VRNSPGSFAALVAIRVALLDGLLEPSVIAQ